MYCHQPQSKTDNNAAEIDVFAQKFQIPACCLLLAQWSATGAVKLSSELTGDECIMVFM